MIAYILIYVFMFCFFTTPWKFVLICLSSFILSPSEQKSRIFASFILAFCFFVFLISPCLVNYQSGDYYLKNNESFTFINHIIGPIKQYVQEKDCDLNPNAKMMYSSLVMGKLDCYSDFGNLVKEHGIIHLFVVSGFHFSILFMIISFIINKILKIPYKLSLIVVLILSTLYYMILPSGFGSARAYFTIILGITAFFLGRSADSENVLFTISLFWVIASPLSIYQLGFQLTFAASYLIILASKIKFIKKIDSIIIKNLILSLIVSFGIASFLFVKGKNIVVLSFLIVAISTPLISILMIFMFLKIIIPYNLIFLDNILSKLINCSCDIYHNFLLSISNLSQLKIILPVDLSIIIQLSIIFLFFSRKMLSYGWEVKKIIILFLLNFLICYL